MNFELRVKNYETRLRAETLRLQSAGTVTLFLRRK